MLPSDVAPPIVAFSHHRDHELRLDQVPLDVPIKVTISDGETRVGDGAWSVGWEESAELGALLIDGRPGARYCMPVVSFGILKSALNPPHPAVLTASRRLRMCILRFSCHPRVLSN